MPVPHRFQERSFRRYEAILVKVQNAFPTSVRFRPVEFATETVSCRIRDCVTAFLRSDWVSEVDRDWLQDYWNDLVVSHDGTWITIGKRSGRNQVEKCNIVLDTGGAEGVTRIVLTRPPPKVFDAICVLIDAGVIMEPVLVKDLDEGTINYITKTLLVYPNLLMQPTSEPTSCLIL